MPSDAKARRLSAEELLSSDPVAWLRQTLGGLVEATDAITSSITQRDITALGAAVARAEALTDALGRANPVLDEMRGDRRIRAAAPELVALRERLRENGRRNAVLIQRAWELDAAAVRLLVRLVSPDAELPAGAYQRAAAPRLLDTPA